MYQPNLKKIHLIAGIAAILVIAGVTMSFQGTPFGPIDRLDSLTELPDTIPANKDEDELKMSIKDFDQLLLHLDDESINIQEEISRIDYNKIQKEINSSLEKVDFNKIKLDLDKALKEIDFTKIEQGIESALSTIEWNKMNRDAKISLEEAKKEIEKINMAEVKKEMMKAKFEIEKSGREIKKLNVAEMMKYANEGIAASKTSMRLKKEMFNEMEQDGLIRQREGFNIEFRDKTLIINGKKQNDATYQHYRHYIQGDSYKITISKE